MISELIVMSLICSWRHSHYLENIFLSQKSN